MSAPTRPQPAMPVAKTSNYESDAGALDYRDVYSYRLGRKLSDRWERRIYGRFLDQLGPLDTVLDLPCGPGRLAELLASRANRVIEADWSGSMVRLNREDHPELASKFVQGSGLAIPLVDGAVDLVASIRLSHHFENQADRELHMREVFRVSRRGVIVSWFSHHSIKNLVRRARGVFDGRSPKNTLTSARVREIATEAGYRQVAAYPLSRISSGHIFGCFERDTASDALLPIGGRASDAVSRSKGGR
jgi:ubiquinone/menaquinone biosynthesis C-methylase UbiE